jgi:hypothetical protein
MLRKFKRWFQCRNGETTLKTRIGRDSEVAERKKEEFPGSMVDMPPGNSFPRSALFLETFCGNSRFPARVHKDCGIK